MATTARAKTLRGPRLGRPTGKFTQHRRLDKLREVLEGAPLGLTLDELASALHVDPRSVRRYLRELDGSKDNDKFSELESVPVTPGGAHRWRIKPGVRGRAVTIRRAQAYSLLSTRRALEVLRGSALFDEADLALSHIEKVAQTPFRAAGRAEISGQRGLEARFFWNPPPARSYASRGEDLDEVFRAVADLRVLRFRPRTRAAETRAERVVFHPYAMVVHDGSIVVLGVRGQPRSPSRGETDEDGEPAVEVLTLEVMAELRASETEHFDLPATFDVSHYVHGAFGLGRPSKTRALVEFDARVADEIRAKKWIRDQRIAMSVDGRLRLSVPLVNVDAFVTWVLSFGDAARVVDPPELARRVATTLERAAERYR
ncbi:MAG: putative transcriptional regulator [Labilithrix sp.]|nr:putative transcriptional regulator [Labilithrix sp.]